MLSCIPKSLRPTHFSQVTSRGFRGLGATDRQRRNEIRQNETNRVGRFKLDTHKDGRFKFDRLPRGAQLLRGTIDSPVIGRRSRTRLSGSLPQNGVQDSPSDESIDSELISELIERVFASRLHQFLHNDIKVVNSDTTQAGKRELSDSVLSNLSDSQSSTSSSLTVGCQKTATVPSISEECEKAFKQLQDLSSLSDVERRQLWSTLSTQSQIPSSQVPMSQMSRIDDSHRTLLLSFERLFFTHRILLSDVPYDLFFERVDQILKTKCPEDFFNPEFVKDLKVRLYGDNSLPIPVMSGGSGDVSPWTQETPQVKRRRQQLIEYLTKYVRRPGVVKIV